MTRRARCAVCGSKAALNKAGEMPAHYTYYQQGWSVRKSECIGSNKKVLA